MVLVFRKQNRYTSLLIRKKHFERVIYTHFNRLLRMYCDRVFTVCLCFKFYASTYD